MPELTEGQEALVQEAVDQTMSVVHTNPAACHGVPRAVSASYYEQIRDQCDQMVEAMKEDEG